MTIHMDDAPETRTLPGRRTPSIAGTGFEVCRYHVVLVSCGHTRIFHRRKGGNVGQRSRFGRVDALCEGHPRFPVRPRRSYRLECVPVETSTLIRSGVVVARARPAPAVHLLPHRSQSDRSPVTNMPPACGWHRRACNRPNRCTLHTTGGLRTDDQLGRVCDQRFAEVYSLY